MKRKPTDIPGSLKMIDVESLLRKRGIYSKQHTNKELKVVAKQMLKAKRKKKSSPHPQFTMEQIENYGSKQLHIVEIVEKQFENKVYQFIVNTEAEFLKRFDDEVKTRKSFVKFIKKDYYTDHEDELIVQAGVDFNPLLENVAILAGNEANKLIGVEEPYILYDYKGRIARNVEKFTRSLLDTDREHLANIITNGLQDGKSVPEIRKEIESTFDQYSRMQAQRITRTEVIRASNQAALDAYERSGVVEGKQWVTFGAVDECAQYDGKIETLNGKFYSDTTEFKDGDPPIHPNCRCIIVPIVGV